MLCLVGMTLGMAFDYRRIHFLPLDFCTGDLGVMAMMERHVALMPGMYIGVAFATAIGLCRDMRIAFFESRTVESIARSLVCTALMLTGMLAASLVAMQIMPFHPISEWLSMTLGMALGHSTHLLAQRPKPGHD